MTLPCKALVEPLMLEFSKPASASPRAGKEWASRLVQFLRAALTLFLGVLILLCARPGAAQTFGCTPPMANDIVCENSKPGNSPDDWTVTDVGDTSIQGFATDISVPQGGTISFTLTGLDPQNNTIVACLRSGLKDPNAPNKWSGSFPLTPIRVGETPDKLGTIFNVTLPSDLKLPPA